MSYPFLHAPVVQSTSEGSYRFVFACDVNVNIAVPHFRASTTRLVFPLMGEWFLSFEGATDGQTAVSVVYGAMPMGALGQRVKVRLEFLWRDADGKGRLVERSDWAPQPFPFTNLSHAHPSTSHRFFISSSKLNEVMAESPTFDPNSHCAYRVIITLEQDYPEDPSTRIAEARQAGDREGRIAGEEAGWQAGFREGRREVDGIRTTWTREGIRLGREAGVREGKDVGRTEGREQGRAEVLAKELPEALEAVARKRAEEVSDTPAKKTPHDFRLFFPHLLDSGAELWTSSKFLSHSSPYFETLLSSSFSEATSRRSKRARTETSSVEAPRAPTTEERDYDGDSDDETDTFLCSRIPPILDDASAADDLPYCEIRITQTAYSTYRAVLLFLQTGHISFTPLSSSLSTSRDDYLASKLEESPNLPLPVSPKSVFRLADLLDLPSLKALALTSFKSSLTVDGAAHELFSDASVLYRELRTAVLQFVKEKADEVKATAGREDVMRKVEQDEVKGSAPILLELLRMGVAL